MQTRTNAPMAATIAMPMLRAQTLLVTTPVLATVASVALATDLMAVKVCLRWLS